MSSSKFLLEYSSREDEANERREDNEWELGPDCPDEGLKAHALFQWLVDNGDATFLSDEDRIKIRSIENEIERLNSEYNDAQDVRSDLLKKIEELEDEIDEIKGGSIDVYNIIPTGDFYDMTEFEVIDAGLENRRYVVGNEDETKESARVAVKNLIDDVGYDGFSPSFVSSHLDTDKITDMAHDSYSEDVYNNPEVYFEDSDRLLSDRQQEKINLNKMRINQLEEKIFDLESFDEDFSEEIDLIQEEIDEIVSDISDIENDPQGDFPDELMEEKIEDLVNYVRRDPESYLSDMGLDYSDFVDEDEFIDAVIDADGYGHTLNHYDGNEDEVEIEGETYYVMRID